MIVEEALEANKHTSKHCLLLSAVTKDGYTSHH